MILKSYFQQYQPFLLFLGKFFLSYLLLTVSYQFYLSLSEKEGIDGITTNVAWFTTKLANGIGIPLETKVDALQFQIYYHAKYLARIVEGCNSVSVILLFTSFIVAFSTKIRPVVVYVLLGSVCIYLVNIFRIICLTVLLDRFPSQEHLLHGVLFPLVIYGLVFVLWFFWVTKIVKNASK